MYYFLGMYVKYGIVWKCVAPIYSTMHNYSTEVYTTLLLICKAYNVQCILHTSTYTFCYLELATPVLTIL
jgi:hypothetical protein